jgi:hypothetical protein
MQTHARACVRAIPPIRTHKHARSRGAQVREGGLIELDMSGKEGLAVALVAAGLLERSAATLTRLDVR